jgi:hypothetical protein
MTDESKRNQTAKDSGRSDMETVQFKFLSWDQIQMIDDALAGLGKFGEVHLVIQKGRLRFLVTQESHDALKSVMSASSIRRSNE